MATLVMFRSSVPYFGLQCGVLLEIDMSSIAWTYHFLSTCFGGNLFLVQMICLLPHKWI